MQRQTRKPKSQAYLKKSLSRVRSIRKAFSMLYGNFLFMVLPINLYFVRAELCVPCSSTYSTKIPNQPPSSTTCPDPASFLGQSKWQLTRKCCYSCTFEKKPCPRMDEEQRGRVVVGDSWVLVQGLSLIDVGSFQTHHHFVDAKFPNKSKWAN